MRSPIGQQIDGIFDRQHALRRVGGHPIRRVGGHSIIHEHPDRTAYFETGSQPRNKQALGPLCL
jgi:hypothetical protein